MNRARRTRAEAGFTLIELVVVVMIIGILAAIALPAFLNQRAKGQDASAESDARSMVAAMEACYTEVDQYTPCPDANTGLDVGSLPGQVEGTPTGGGATYVVTAYSHSGNSFTVTKNQDYTVTRTCSDAGHSSAGCRSGVW